MARSGSRAVTRNPGALCGGRSPSVYEPRPSPGRQVCWQFFASRSVRGARLPSGLAWPSRSKPKLDTSRQIVTNPIPARCVSFARYTSPISQAPIAETTSQGPKHMLEVRLISSPARSSADTRRSSGPRYRSRRAPDTHVGRAHNGARAPDASGRHSQTRLDTARGTDRGREWPARGIEPRRALVGSAAFDPEVEGLEVGFRALHQVNAECHASVGAD